MVKCRICKHNYKPYNCEPKCNMMCDGKSDFEPITNAYRIRNMTDEELADVLIDFIACEVCEHQVNINGYEVCNLDNPCVEEYAKAMALKWLQAEVEEGAEHDS